MNKKRIHLVEDEPDMIKIASDLLEADGYRVFSSATAAEALKKLPASPPDLILLDIQLPDKDGFTLLKELKADPKTKSIPIIMVSVRAEEADVVVGLELGAEDYISKPYRKRELLARVKAVIRRKDNLADDEKLSAGPFEIDFGRYTAKVGTKDLSLTPKEFELLAFFIKREGRVNTRAIISESVWGIEFTGSTRTIDVHVDQLRGKLGRFGKCIEGLKGVGYRFELP